MVYTENVEPEMIMDLNVMVGEMEYFKELLTNKVYEITGKNQSESLDNNDYAKLYKIAKKVFANGKQIEVGDKWTEVNIEDLSEIHSLFEEYHRNLNDLLGFHDVNGLPFFGMTVANDGEWTVYTVLISDGLNIYSYIPLKGNSYNPEFMSAFGNHDENLDDEDENFVNPEVDKDMIYEDISIAFDVKYLH